MSVFQGQSGPINYKLEGTGPSIALVHGVGADLESWDGVVEALRSKYRLLRHDLRGHGASAKVKGRYELDDFVGDLAELLDHLEIGRTHLAGFSLGGIIAQGFALEHAARLDRLVLISAIAGRTQAERDRMTARAKVLREGGGSAHVDSALNRWFTDEFLANNRDLVEKRLERGRSNDPECYRAAYRVLAETDLADELHRIDVPTLVMTGEFDVGSTPRMSRLMADRIPDSKLHILNGLKHSVLIEAPDLIATRMDEFLAA